MKSAPYSRVPDFLKVRYPKLTQQASSTLETGKETPSMDIKEGDHFRHSGSGMIATVLWSSDEYVVVGYYQNATRGLPQCYYKTAFGTGLGCSFTAIPRFVEGDRVYRAFSGGVRLSGVVLGVWEDRAWVKYDDRSVPESPLIINLCKGSTT